MLNQRRLLLAIAGGAAVAALSPAALAQADSTCSAAVCLISGGDPTDVYHSGIPSFYEETTDVQPTNVYVPGSTFTEGIAGSYQVNEFDYSNPFFDNATYHFGDFTPSTDNVAGIDGGLAGATLYDLTYGPGGKIVDGTTMYDLNIITLTDLEGGMHFDIYTFPGLFTTFYEETPTGVADWIEPWGSTTPHLLFSSLSDSAFPEAAYNLASILPPDEWFPVMTEMFPAGLT